jgi:hypothetical protein
MDPISGLAILGTSTMLYNVGSYFYNYIYPEDDISDKRILEIEKELIEESHNDILEKVYEITKSYDIGYCDVIRELKQVLKKRRKQIDNSNSNSDISDSDSDLPVTFIESQSEDLYMSDE